MPSSNDLTYEQTPPLRPGIGDVGGGAKINDVLNPPDPQTMPTAEDANQTAKQLVALGSVAAMAIFEVTIAAGTPSITALTTVRTDKVVGDFTVTDNGVGDTSIDWAAGTFPAKTTQPVISVFEDADHRGAVAFNTASGGTRGVRCKTRDGAGALADRNFVVMVFGE